MARIIYSGLVTKIAGSIGGTTFQSNKHGFSVKNKANMVSPQSVDQNSAKARFAFAVSSWSAASQSTRDNWNAWATANPQYAYNNPSSQLSGFEVFVRYHVIKFRLSLLITTNPVGGLAAVPSFAPTASVMGAGVAVIPNSIGGAYPLVANMSAAVNIKKSWNFIGSRPRYADVSNIPTSTNYLSEQWCQKYGYVPTAGDILLLRFQVWNLNNGQVAAPQDYRVTLS